MISEELFMYIFIILYIYRFDGRVVAKLPFVPVSLLQSISHRNLLGDDYTDSSFIFLYILCTMSIRQVLGIVFYISIHPLHNVHLTGTWY